MKLSDGIKRYRSEILITKSPNYQRMTNQQLRYWESKFPNKSLARITPSMIRENLPDHVSLVTKNRYLEALSTFYTACVIDWEIVKENPVFKVRKFPEPRGRVRYLDDNERHRLLDACQSSKHKYLYTIVIIALSTGMRRSEITTLTFEQIDLNRKTIILWNTKNKSQRVVPLVGKAYELVANLHRRSLPKSSDKLFPGKSIRCAWLKAINDSGVKDFTFHGLRHTAASYMAMNGVPLHTIGTILGHQSLRQTMIYAHLSVDHLRDTLKGLNDMMFE